jgi:ABC-type dipeptide/oligopeptide/nickel transport system ATPase component
MVVTNIIRSDITDRQKIGELVIKKAILARLESKKNTFIAIVGGTGEGKSYTALRIAELIEPNFDVREQIIYYPQQFLNIIQNAINKNYKVLMLDEAHTTIPARLWYNFTNLAINFVASTFRQLKALVLIIVTPSIGWIDKTIREMINFYGVVFRRLPDRPVELRLYEVAYDYFNLREEYPYLRKLKFVYRRGVCKLDTVIVGMPSQKLIEEYEKVSSEYKRKLLENQLKNVLGKIEKATVTSTANISEIANTLIENQKLLFTLMKKRKEGMELKKGEVKRLFKLSDSEFEQLNAEVIEKIKALGWV